MYAFAHRGGRAHGRDNEIATFVEALRRGATGLETDAWVTSDGQVVLDHDGVHRAAARRRTPISQIRRSELPTHVPTLDDLYAACGTDFELAIDIKNSDTADGVVRVAEAHSAADRLWLFAHTGVTFDHLGDAHSCKTLHARLLLGPNRRHQLQAAKAAGVTAINARWMWWRRSLVEEVHALDMLAFGYDAQKSSSIQRCVDVGLDGMFSDHVDRMHAALTHS
jgi:glycerophosphoryl diester phosphodiesterase